MPFLHEDERFLQRALTLAAEAAAFASPNPTVGCAFVREGKVVGEGAHRYDARDHAEIAALKNAALRRHSAKGATAYVTLEPCSHHGRTGPCADALIAAGISRCIVATVDPNPVVSGSGVAKLRAAGIETDVLDVAHPLAQKARRLNDAFAFAIQHGRPFITLKSALSVDGKLAPAKRGQVAPHWLTGPAAREDVQRLRHLSDAILVGIGTVLADDPELTDRTGLPRRRRLLRIIFDSQLRMPLDARLVSTAQDDVLLLCHQNAAADRSEALRRKGVEVIALPGDGDRLDPHAFLTAVQPYKLLSVLMEAGNALNSSFLSAGLVDKAVLYFSETELGADAVPFATTSPFTLQQRLTETSRETFPHGAGEDVRISGYIRDPWSNI